MIDLFEAARQLQVFCDGQGWRSCFIGGLLAAYRGRIQDAREFARRHRVVLLRTPDGVGIDVSLGALPFEERVISRATLFSFGPQLDLRTCSAEDLIVLKLFASRPLDLRDAEGVAVRQHDQLDWLYIEEQLRPLAEIKEEPAILSTLSRLRKLSV